MKQYLENFRLWTAAIPDHIGELIAIIIYLTFMLSAAGAVASFTLGAYIPTAIFLGGVALTIALVMLL